jgi:hypothetical protein
MKSLDLGGTVLLVVTLRELDILKRGLSDTIVINGTETEDTPANRPAIWAQRHASELLAKMPSPFKCESFVYAGPGHQSQHTCEIEYEHPLAGEHHDFNTWWEGTASYEMVEQDWETRHVGPEDMNIEAGDVSTGICGDAPTKPGKRRPRRNGGCSTPPTTTKDVAADDLVHARRHDRQRRSPQGRTARRPVRPA